MTTLKEVMAEQRMPQKILERDLTAFMRGYDIECSLMTANRLNRLRRGSTPTPDELRALSEWSENTIDSFRDVEATKTEKQN